MTNPSGASGQASGSATNTAGQAPAHNTSPAGQAPTQANSQNNDHDDLEDIPPERLRKMLADIRKSEAAHRTEAKELRQWREERERNDLSDSERKDKEIAKHQEIAAKATAENQRLRVERAVDREAARLGIDPDVASRLIDWSDLEYDDDGKPKNATKLLEALVKDKPYLVTGTPTAAAAAASQNGNGATGNGSSPNVARQLGGGATNPPSRSTGNEPMSQAVYESLMHDKDAYNARRHEVQAWLAKQR